MSDDNTPAIVAVDAGTTGVRSRAVFIDGSPTVASYREFTQRYPQPGWVEHDPEEIWQAVVVTLAEVIDAVGRDRVTTLGITNQRETVVAWNRSTGVPYGSAIVWQDRRTADVCERLKAEGHQSTVRQRTGLVLDPYFSGTKFGWLIANRGLPVDDDLALGTIDSWLIWNLTGGEVFATDATNASRTMLCDIRTRVWDPELGDLLGVPISSLGEIVPSSGRIGITSDVRGVPDGIAISGVAGDQQAALFGQACVKPGMAKTTYGTGSFILLNVGEACPDPTEDMLTTVAWTLADGTTHYAYEGSVFSTGAAIQWLRDGLEIIKDVAETGPLASSVENTDGVYIVPAFAGLGAPHWDPYARGSIVGLTRGTTRAHIARAVVESIAYQVRDVIDVMVAAGIPVTDLRVDGGASVMDILCQFQADQLGVTVNRPVDQETTSLGVAFLAGLAEGVWTSTDDIAKAWKLNATFKPESDRTTADAGHADWLRAVKRSKGWAS